MSYEHTIYNEIGAILIKIALENSKIILMRSELSAENDVCTFEFDCFDKDNNFNWVTAGTEYGSKLNDLLVELRQFFKSQNQPYWEGCEFQVDLETGKFEVKFIYEE